MSLTNSEEQAKAHGTSRSYQLVAQSAALAVQDATDHMRNVNTIGAAAMGAGMANFLSTGNPEHIGTLHEQTKAMNEEAVSNFKSVGTNASKVVKNYFTPSNE